jgi:nicotinamidase-related amidase
MLPLPPHYQANQVGKIWRVPYQQRAIEAAAWATQYNIQPAHQDQLQVGLLLIDVQNTFCIPEFELFVGGRSGLGAVEDNQRLCEFIYRHLDKISQIILTLDTHTALQIFHPIFWVNQQGQHPTPASTLIHYEDVQQGVWQVNPAIASSLTGRDYPTLQAHALHYTRQLNDHGKYPLTVWPYHSMLGGMGHAIAPAVEEAVFFHTIARHSPAQFELKGNHPLTENYSVLQPEVLDTVGNQPIAQKNQTLIQKLLNFDRLIIAGQAKSHCVAWTVEDLLTEIQAINPQLTQRIDLLEDCTTPVVVPGLVDYTEPANATFERFAAAGMNVIESVQWR